MTNDELLDKIRTIVREEVKAETEPIKQGMVTKSDIEDMATKHDISGLAEDIAEFFHKTWEKMDKTTQETNDRLTIIEDHLGLPHQTDN